MRRTLELKALPAFPSFVSPTKPAISDAHDRFDSFRRTWNKEMRVDAHFRYQVAYEFGLPIWIVVDREKYSCNNNALMRILYHSRGHGFSLALDRDVTCLSDAIHSPRPCRCALLSDFVQLNL